MNETTNETLIDKAEEFEAQVVLEEPVVKSSGPRYELTLILRPNLDDAARAEQLEKVTQLLVRFNATIEKVDEWGRRRLAYEIEKTNEGFYYFITFGAETSTPAEIESRVRIMEGILRYLIIRIEE